MRKSENNLWVFTESDKPSKNWNTKQLRQYIRTFTPVINKRLESYVIAKEQYGIEDKRVESLVKKLQKLGTGKLNDKFKIFMGLTYKVKEDLVKQAKAISKFLKFDAVGVTPKAKEEYSKKFKQAYKTFSKTHPNVSIDEYRKIVDMFAGARQYFRLFGYEASSSGSSTKTSDFADVVVDAIASSGKSSDDVIEAIKEIADKIEKDTDRAYTTEDAIDLLVDMLNDRD